jgi:hypothetical protein
MQLAKERRNFLLPVKISECDEPHDLRNYGDTLRINLLAPVAVRSRKEIANLRRCLGLSSQLLRPQ